jgi:thioredoxin-like negative regulator of GroEL
MASRADMLKEVLAQNPQDTFARYGLAMEYRNAGDTEAALREFDTLLQSNPDYIAAYFMAAQTLAAAGRNDEAKSRLKAGIATAQRKGDQHATSEMSAMLEELGG